MSDRIVAVGFLTSHDLEVLGKGFTRHFSVPDEDVFADLLRQLDQIDIEPLGNTVVLRPPTPGASAR